MLVKETETLESSADNGTSNQNKTGKPQTVVCFICGREFGTKSIEYNAKLKKNYQKHLKSVPDTIGPDIFITQAFAIKCRSF